MLFTAEKRELVYINANPDLRSKDWYTRYTALEKALGDDYYSVFIQGLEDKNFRVRLLCWSKLLLHDQTPSNQQKREYYEKETEPRVQLAILAVALKYSLKLQDSLTKEQEEALEKELTASSVEAYTAREESRRYYARAIRDCLVAQLYKLASPRFFSYTQARSYLSKELILSYIDYYQRNRSLELPSVLYFLGSGVPKQLRVDFDVAAFKYKDIARELTFIVEYSRDLKKTLNEYTLKLQETNSERAEFDASLKMRSELLFLYKGRSSFTKNRIALRDYLVELYSEEDTLPDVLSLERLKGNVLYYNNVYDEQECKDYARYYDVLTFQALESRTYTEDLLKIIKERFGSICACPEWRTFLEKDETNTLLRVSAELNCIQTCKKLLELGYLTPNTRRVLESHGYQVSMRELDS